MEPSSTDIQAAGCAANEAGGRRITRTRRIAARLRDIAVVAGLMCVPLMSGQQGPSLPRVGELMDKAHAAYVIMRMSLSEKARGPSGAPVGAESSALTDARFVHAGRRTH